MTYLPTYLHRHLAPAGARIIMTSSSEMALIP